MGVPPKILLFVLLCCACTTSAPRPESRVVTSIKPSPPMSSDLDAAYTEQRATFRWELEACLRNRCHVPDGDAFVSDLLQRLERAQTLARAQRLPDAILALHDARGRIADKRPDYPHRPEPLSSRPVSGLKRLLTAHEAQRMCEAALCDRTHPRETTHAHKVFAAAELHAHRGEHALAAPQHARAVTLYLEVLRSQPKAPHRLRDYFLATIAQQRSYEASSHASKVFGPMTCVPNTAEICQNARSLAARGHKLQERAQALYQKGAWTASVPMSQEAVALFQAALQLIPPME